MLWLKAEADGNTARKQTLRTKLIQPIATELGLSDEDSEEGANYLRKVRCVCASDLIGYSQMRSIFILWCPTCPT